MVRIGKNNNNNKRLEDMVRRKRTYRSRVDSTVAQKLKAMSTVVSCGAFVELIKINGMLERAVLDEAAVGDVLIVLG